MFCLDEIFKTKSRTETGFAQALYMPNTGVAEKERDFRLLHEVKVCKQVPLTDFSGNTKTKIAKNRTLLCDKTNKKELFTQKESQLFLMK